MSKEELCEQLTACFNNNFNEVYECLGNPFDDEDQYSENLELVCDSQKYSDLHQTMKDAIVKFEKDTSKFDQDNVKVTKELIVILRSLQEDQKDELSAGLNAFADDEDKMKTVYETLQLVKLSITLDAFAKDVHSIGNAKIIDGQDPMIRAAFEFYDKESGKSCERTDELHDLLTTLEGTRAVKTVLGTVIDKGEKIPEKIVEAYDKTKEKVYNMIWGKPQEND